MAVAPGARVAGYRLGRLLGSGSHGTVHLAEELATGERVALKLVPLPAGDGAASRQFLRHAATAQGLKHPGIVALHAAGVQGNTGWLAMEAVPGTDLQRYTAPARLLPEPVVLRIGARLAEALAHAHALGVVHRDIKPANVLVHWPDDLVKLGDFGLARTADAQATRTGLLLGSPGYMAPELLAGTVPDARTDFYALGVTLFQLLSGRLPFEGDTMGALLRQVATSSAPDLRQMHPRLPAHVATLVARLLSRQADRRAETAAKLAQELHAAGQALPP
jgi:eukaryotic-like serine/threonine-protein kinase